MWRKKLIHLLSNSIVLNVAYKFCFVVPNTLKLNKYVNYIRVLYAVRCKSVELDTYPYSVRIAPVSTCNYRCVFCEIHKDNLLYPKRSRNMLSLADIKNYKGLLSHAITVNFYGGSEEPLLAKEIGSIILYLKEKFGVRLVMNTNASMMKGKLLKDIVRSNFDYILVSYHAGEKHAYRNLMTGDIDKINKNLYDLNCEKNKLRNKNPVVAFNYAIHKENADQYTFIIDQSVKLGVSEVVISKYYGGRNKLDDKKVSFEYDVESGNKVLDKIYSYASDKKVSLIPKTPKYWSDKIREYNEEDVNYLIYCYSPWTSIHFNPVLDDKNAHYVGVCNRMEIFKVYYKKYLLNSHDSVMVLWNHPILLYLRKTVNENSDINPICKFCKNNEIAYIRNRYPDKYAKLRDFAITEFFKKFNALFTKVPFYDGLVVLSENPHSDKRYLEITNP